MQHRDYTDIVGGGLLVGTLTRMGPAYFPRVLGYGLAGLVPVLQIACAAAVAVLLRAKLPVAAAATLVSNPFTYVPIYVLAYRIGAALLGAPVDPARAEATVAAPARDLRAWPALAMRVGKPLALGRAVFGVAGAALAWFAVELAWRIAVALRRRRGARCRGGAPPPT
jgi:uncharacterized protein